MPCILNAFFPISPTLTTDTYSKHPQHRNRALLQQLTYLLTTENSFKIYELWFK